MIIKKYYHTITNLLALAAVLGILVGAFIIEFVDKALPCPLCYLQRAAFIAVGISLMMNLFIAIRPAHYGLLIFSSCFGLLTSGRQVALHVADAGYGKAILGLHLYTWSLIFFALFILYGAFSLLFDDFNEKIKRSRLKESVGLFFLMVVALNLILALVECGIFPCPDNPTKYWMLSFIML